jgi:hypothetical protein
MTLVLTAGSPPYNYRKGKLAAAAYPKFIAAVIIAYELASTRDGGAQLLVLKPDGLSALRRLLDGWGGQGDLGRRLGRELRLPSPMTATDRHVLDVYPACVRFVFSWRLRNGMCTVRFGCGLCYCRATVPSRRSQRPHGSLTLLLIFSHSHMSSVLDALFTVLVCDVDVYVLGCV